MSKTAVSAARIVGWVAAVWAAAMPAFANGHGGAIHGGGFHAGFHGGTHVAVGGARFYGGGHGYAAPYYGHAYSRAAYGGYGGYGGYRGFAGYGHRPGWGGGYWRGGYWNGGYWPGAYYRGGYSWFLPVLPVGYLTLWWGGLPYYYWDDAYYLWSPRYRGYVVTDPPPVAGSAAGGQDDTPASGGSPDLYVYPRNGQSDAQTSKDRFECHQWSVGQTGFDPSSSSNPSGSNASNYQRAMKACLDARGYSAR
jgi:hypothetical protein